MEGAMNDALKQIWEKVDQMLGPQRMETEAEHIARDMREGRFPERSDPIQVPVAGPAALAAAVPADLAEAGKVLEGVTPGPWKPVSYQSGTVQVMMREWNNAKPDPMRDGSMYGYVSAYMSAYNIGWQDENDIDREKQANARFIAWCREGVPALLARIRELEGERDKDGEEILDLRFNLEAAEATVATLTAQVEAMRGALEPFGAVLRGNYANQPDDLQITAGHGQWDMRFMLTLGDFRRAAALTTENQSNG